MHVLSSLAVALLAFPQNIAAHGYLKSIQVNGQAYPAWQVGQDDYLAEVWKPFHEYYS